MKSRLSTSALAALTLVAIALVAASTGAMHIAPGRILGALFEPLGVHLPWAPTSEERAVLFAVRLPRVLLGIVVGATLSTCGGAMQGLLRNPLADPAILGVSGGAALGAVSTIVLVHDSLSALALPAAGFAGALIATGLLLALSRRDGVTSPTTLILVGVALTAISSAGIGLLSYLATDAQLRAITFWTLGSLGNATWRTLTIAAVPMALALVVLPRFGRELDLLALGESEARHLGMRVERVRRLVVIVVAFGVGAAVALTGVIGFVGLVVPHVVRLLLGPKHRLLLTISAMVGASLLLAADLLARTIVAPAEVPIGVVTAAIGAPFFLWLLVRDQTVRRWS